MPVDNEAFRCWHAHATCSPHCPLCKRSSVFRSNGRRYSGTRRSVVTIHPFGEALVADDLLREILPLVTVDASGEHAFAPAHSTREADEVVGVGGIAPWLTCDEG